MVETYDYMCAGQWVNMTNTFCCTIPWKAMTLNTWPASVLKQCSPSYFPAESCQFNNTMTRNPPLISTPPQTIFIVNWHIHCLLSSCSSVNKFLAYLSDSSKSGPSHQGSHKISTWYELEKITIKQPIKIAVDDTIQQPATILTIVADRICKNSDCVFN